MYFSDYQRFIQHGRASAPVNLALEDFMTPQQIVGLAVRLFSIWLVIVAMQMVGAGIGSNKETGLEPSAVSFILAGLTFGLAVALWFFPMFVAHQLVPRTKFDNLLRVPANEAVVVACVIFGLWLFVSRVLPSLSHYIALAVQVSAEGTPLGSSSEFQFVRLAPLAIEFAVSAVLCLKPRAIAKFFTTERSSPRDE